MWRKWKSSHICLWYCYDTISVRYWKIYVLKVHLVCGFGFQNPVLQFLYGWQVWKYSIPTSVSSTYQTYLYLWNKIPGFLCSPADQQENYTYLHLKSVWLESWINIWIRLIIKPENRWKCLWNRWQKNGG